MRVQHVSDMKYQSWNKYDIFIINSNIINSIRTTVFEHLPFTHYNCEAAYNTNEVLE